MKTTVEIQSVLRARAKRHARQVGKPLRALIKDWLRRVLEDAETPERYELPDLRVGNAGGPDPLESLSWPELRDEIYRGGTA